MVTYRVPWFTGFAPEPEWPEERPEDWPEDDIWPPEHKPLPVCQPGALIGGEVVWYALPAGLRTKSFDIEGKTGVVTSEKEVNIPGWEKV